MSTKYVILMLIILLLPTSVNAAYFEDYEIFVDGKTEKVTITVDLILEEEVSGLDLSLFADPSNVEIFTDPESSHRITSEGISIDFNERTAGPVHIQIEFKGDVVKDSGDRNTFSLAFSSPLEIRNFLITLALPEGSTGYRQGGDLLASPDPVTSTDGSRILYEWNDQLEPGESYVVFASFTTPPVNLLVWLGIPTLIILLILGSGVGYHFYNRQKNREKILKTLNEDERMLFEFVLERKELRQDELRDLTDFSKSKISKVVRNLEKKEVVEKVPYRKTNKLKPKI